MLELVRIDLPGKGSGFTLRYRDRYARPEGVEFLGADQRVWLFRTMSDLRAFLASEDPVAAPWRDLVEAEGRELDHERAERFNLWQMIASMLRWGPGDEAGPCSYLWCSDLCVELAFYCESAELLDELGPDLRTACVHRWRRIIPVIGSLVRFWREPDRTPSRTSLSPSEK